MAFTYFFRDLQTLELVRDHALPLLQGRRFLDVWDAGCAMGPEPYSLAIVLRQSMGHFGFRNVRIFATDIDSSNLFAETIARGIYPFEQIQRIPDEIRNEYFSPVQGSADEHQIREDMRRAVIFAKHDLLSLSPIRGDISIVMCKNVLLHFSEDERAAVIRMFHGALVDGGFLVNEQTQALPPAVAGLFTPVVPNARIYRKVL